MSKVTTIPTKLARTNLLAEVENYLIDANELMDGLGKELSNGHDRANAIHAQVMRTAVGTPEYFSLCAKYQELARQLDVMKKEYDTRMAEIQEREKHLLQLTGA